MSGVGRAGAIIAAGTLVSRLTGLVRNIVLAAALGTVGSHAGDAFGVAVALPNSIYDLIASGLLAGVIVPQIVRAVRDHADRGSAFVSKLLTLGVVALVGVLVVALATAPLLVQLYASRLDNPATEALALALAYWVLPQLLFFGLYALLGEVLNARRVFGPYAWAPIINNIVSIIGFSVFVWVFGIHRDATGWSPQMIALIGGTALLGVMLQTVALLFVWRRAGLVVRPDFHWRGIGLRHIARLAGWTFLMVVVGQIAGLIQMTNVSAASGAGASISTLQTAWSIFILPYSVIVMSIGTPFYTRMAEHATAGDMPAVKTALRAQTRLVSLLMVGALAAVVAAIVPISRVFTDDAEKAVAFALVLGAYLLALIPLSLQFGIQRTFYAFQDTRTPFFFTAVQASLVIATTLVAMNLLDRGLLPLTMLALVIALGQSLANLVQLCVAGGALRRKIGALRLGPALRSLLLFLTLGVVSAAAGWGVFLALGGVAGWPTSERVPGILAAGAIGVTTVAVYAVLLLAIGVPEARSGARAGVRLLRRFLPGR